jgi:hypothetical protein
MSEPTTNTNGKANGNGHATTNGHARTNGEVKANGEAHKPSRRKVNRQELAGLIEQVDGLRTVLRDALTKTNELAKGLKQHRRQNRLVQNTLASLRQLKGIGA